MPCLPLPWQPWQWQDMPLLFSILFFGPVSPQIWTPTMAETALASVAGANDQTAKVSSASVDPG